jgi:hypothetical protein
MVQMILARTYLFLIGIEPETLRKRICIHLLNRVHELRDVHVEAILHAQSALLIAENLYFDE